MSEVIKLSEEQLDDLLYSNECKELNLVKEQPGDWTSEGKYESRSDVFMRTTDGKYFELSQCRSGSYCTEYVYEEVDELYEVRKIPVTTYKYEAV